MRWLTRLADRFCSHQDDLGRHFWVKCDRPMVDAAQLDNALALIRELQDG